MKRLLLYAIIAFMALPMLADLNGAGYYRVLNAKTKRYAYLVDDKGSYSVATTSADVGAIMLYADKDRVISDPSTIFYLTPQGNDFYDIGGQGTSIYTFMGEYLNVYKDRNLFDGETNYLIYAKKSGLVKYLGDIWDHPDEDEGLASVDAKGDFRRWYIRPVEADGVEFFGVSPTVEASGKHYAPLYAAFPMSAYSPGVKVYTISEVDSRGAAIVKEITGVVPAGTPVIVECGSPLSSENRMNVGGAGENVGDNKLRGVYFDNKMKIHYNRVEFNYDSMRVLGLSKDGRLAFVRSDLKFIPRNQAILQLTDPAQYSIDEFLVMTAEQRDVEFSGVEAIASDSAVDVYSIDGHLVASQMLKSDINNLGKGLYILKSAGKSEKFIVH